jgi:uncharacterized protein YegJ (DUF2314 family)
VLEVTVGSPETSAAMIARILARLSAALVDLTEDTPVEVLGVIVGGDRPLPADFVQHHATMDPAIGVLVALHIGKPGEGYVLRSSGLADLGLPDLEVIESDRELQEVAMMMQHWSQLMLTEGPSVLYDGATVGEPGQRVDVRSAPASVGGGTVYRLSFAADQGDVPESDNALDMVDAMGGGEVTITIEGDDIAAIAALLANHDPSFDTVVEASDFLREHYAGGRVEVDMLRTFATMLYEDAEKNYPGIRVHCDEALGVLKPDGTLFSSPTSDTAMQDAIAAARASTPSFIARLESPQKGDHTFGIKFPFRDGTQVEHMWVSDVRREGEEFVGIVEAEAQLVGNVEQGSEVRVPVSGISDWGFSNGDAIHGNYTTRVMLDTLPPPMRKALEKRLVPLG